jgi:hypothetical protein
MALGDAGRAAHARRLGCGAQSAMPELLSVLRGTVRPSWALDGTGLHASSPCIAKKGLPRF